MGIYSNMTREEIIRQVEHQMHDSPVLTKLIELLKENPPNLAGYGIDVGCPCCEASLQIEEQSHSQQLLLKTRR